MNVLYVDSMFLENLIIDYILLLITARLTGLSVHRRRILLSAALGGLYAVLAAVGGDFLSSWAFKLAAGILMVMVVFGASDRFFRVTLVFFGVSAAFAGAVMASAFLNGRDAAAIYRGDVSFTSLLLAFALFYVLFTAAFRVIARRRVRGELADLTVTFNNRRVRVSALTDTGNGLTDPTSGLPVAVCSLDALLPLFDRPAAEIIRSAPDAACALEKLCKAGIYSFFLVPYRAVGNGGGMLLAFRPQSLRRVGRELDALVAIDRAGLNTASGYSAVIGA